MRKENFKHLECSLARSLDIIGEWWTLLIIRDLFYGMNTFDLLCNDLNIARNILTNRLKKLADTGIIQKQYDETKSRKQSYRLTKKGMDLFPVIMALVAWGDKWEAPNGPPIIFKHQPNGHAAKPGVICTCCGKPLQPKDIRPKKSPNVKRPNALPMTLRGADNK
ncbi:MAG TPA: helix-turn-helix domain-containing protein [Smithella sp.]|nr:helix-turn-helix domain-containing protein [Smithella sp.]